MTSTSALWCLAPRRPVQGLRPGGVWARKASHGVADTMMIIVTMDDGVVVTIGAGMVASARLSQLLDNVDRVHRDRRCPADGRLPQGHHPQHDDHGVQFPLSTMPGEYVDHVYAGPMERETIHFLEAVAYDRPVMVEPRLARLTMEVYLAADLSAERNEVVELPLARGEAELAMADHRPTLTKPIKGPTAPCRWSPLLRACDARRLLL